MICVTEHTHRQHGRLTRFVIGAALVVLLVGTPRVRADELMVGEKTHRRVQIVSYEKGVVDFRKPNGTFDSVPVWDVDFFLIDSATGLADFNQAEEYLLKGQPAQAVERYERALRIAPEFWPEIAWARLLMAADRAGDTEQAIRAMVHVAANDAVIAAHLLPENLPPARNRDGERILGALDRAARESAGSDAGILVELVRYKTLAGMRDARAQELVERVALSPLPEALVTSRTMSIRLAGLDALIEQGGGKQVIEAINRTLPGVPREFLFDLLLLKSKALLASAGSQQDYYEAALPAMRVAIHGDDDQQVAEGLLLAARAHEQAGLTQDAARLLRECLRKENAAQATLDEARTALTRLRES